MGASCPGIRTDAPETLIRHVVLREIQRERRNRVSHERPARGTAAS